MTECRHKWLAVGRGDMLLCTLCGLEDNTPIPSKESRRAVRDESPPSWDNGIKILEEKCRIKISQ